MCRVCCCSLSSTLQVFDGWEWRRLNDQTTDRKHGQASWIHRSSIIGSLISLTLLMHFVLHASFEKKKNENHQPPSSSSSSSFVQINDQKKKKKKNENKKEPATEKGTDESHAALILISFQALDPTSGFYSIASSIRAVSDDNKLHDTGRLVTLDSETRLLPTCYFVIAYEGRILTSCATLTYPSFYIDTNLPTLQ